MSEESTGGASGLRDRLTPAQKQKLLQNMLRKRAAAAADDAIPRRAGGGPAPLSFAQQRLWLVDRLDPGRATFNVPNPLRLRGALDVAALRGSLDALVSRHETLRTTFPEQAGEPVQVVHPAAATALPVVDLAALPPEARGREAGRLVREEALRPFDLARGPLLRSTLLSLDREEHVACFTLHHVVSDGWSTDVLVREVSSLYAALAAGEEPALPALPVQYADFARWQRSRLTGEVLAAQLGYWRERLAGAPPLLEVPTDRPRAPGLGARTGTRGIALSPRVSQGLRELSRREGTTLFMTVLAAWQVLLGRWAGQEDVVVGTPVAGRTRPELEGLIGFFVNLLPLRGDLGGDPTWTGLLGRVREAALGAYAHQELPFERLVEELGVERSLAYPPVFQAAFSLTPSRAGGGGLRLGGLELEPLGGGVPDARFELDLAFTDAGGVLSGALAYREALFDADTAARMAAHLATVLEAMAADPGARLSELSLLGEADRLQVLEASTGPAAAHPRACVHELLALQAARAPRAPAVSSGGESLTWAELERAANRLAHLLRGRGVGPEARVGVCLESGAAMVAAVLGVMRAGGAYVPLDPAHPAERLAYVLADCGASVLVTESPLLGRLPAFAGEVVRLDAEREALALQPDGAPEGGAGPGNAAYVIYTSGSTGRPKGVVVEHGGLANTVLGARDAFGFSAGEVMPALASYAFDIWAFEVFSPLLAGGEVRLLERGTVRDVERLVEALGEADAFHAVPALMREVVREVRTGVGALPRMRRVFVGGDAVPPDLIGEMRRAFPSARLHVLYGPTEAAILAAASPLRAQGDYAWQVVGRPLPGVGAYVCDAGGSLLPVGVPGELWIGGPGVARGYLGRPELTAERFVPDAVGREPGARLYRSGDRVRRRADGELEFLGRTDAQLKVRGFRVEPGEVEAALLSHPAVREAVVVAREDAPGQRRLVAYLVAREGEGPAAAGLREHLLERLPEHMVPAAYVALERLPLNGNGKLDRRALPAPESEGESPRVAPRTPAEEVLAGIWAEVLGRERVGTGDNFFELGGHSLLVTQVVSRARAAFGVELPLRALFEAPTVAGLAARVAALGAEGGAAAPPIVRVGREEPLPLSFAQQRLWVVDRLEPGSPAYNMPYALRLRGSLDAGVLAASIAGLARRHETLRTTFRERGGVPVQVVHPPAFVPLPILDLRALPEGAREPAALRLAGEEALRPFDLGSGPLLRSALLCLGDEDHVLLFTLHHVVTDAWSMDVLVREVSALYTAFARGEASPLPELPVQYADYAVWQREWLQGEVLDRQIGYWRGHLAGAPPLLEVPTDRPRGAGQGAGAGSHAFTLSAGVSDGLRALARREGATLFMTILAGWQALLARYSGQDDVVVGTPIAGRTRRETEGLIGFFVNMLAMRAHLGGDPTWAGLLGRVRGAALAAYDHQELPFERLVDELGVERSLAHAPVFQVVFALNRGGAEDERLSLGGLVPEAFGGGEGTTRFDLNLSVVDGGGRLAGALTYRASLFDADTAGRMAGHLEALLESMAAGPERRLYEAPLLRGAERAHLLHAWQGADTGYTGDRCLHELVHAQVVRTPDAPALRFGGEDVYSYDALFRRACRFAHLLRERGIGPEQRVAICMEPGPEMIVSVLGVLLAGGAYLPVDPELPSERRDFLVADGGPVLLLAQTALARRLEGAGLPTLYVDAEGGRIDAQSDAVPASGVCPRNLAYVIYTSGSTGRPKGVLVEHAGVGNTVLELGRTYGARPGDRHLLFAPLHFDSSVGDIFLALTHGATLVVAPRDAMLPGEDALLRLLREERITHMKTTSSALAALPWGPLPELRSIVTGGEVCTAELIRTWGQERSFFNGYGATEASIRTTSTVYRDPDRDPPIGHPAPNTRIYVLDEAGEPVPFGVAGEIYIGGAGVARGYLNRPELTAERFLPDPHQGAAGARLYRTGDKGRRRTDGEVEFLGRVDFQVKVRGYRVELGEIEAALREHAAVREAVALLRDDAGGDPRLVAYVVSEEGVRAAGPELRSHLEGKLPEYMVPGAYVVLDQLPLNPNGKLDRRALPAPQWSGEEAYVAPRTTAEELLCGIWAEVLGTGRVGTGDNFFELGGHSLLATQVVSRARQVFGTEVPLRALFEAPTVAGLAARVEALRSGGSAAAPPILRAPRDGPLPLSFAQQRLWVVDRLDPGSPAYNMAYALRLRGSLDVAALRAGLDALLRRHETLRTTFEERGGVPVQVVRPPVPAALLEVDLRGRTEAEREREAERLAGEEALRPFDLARGPLMRCTLGRLADDDHVLLFTLHHIVSDGWSRGVLMREVSALYTAFARGEEPSLPELPVQYADYAAWQRGWLAGSVLEEQIGYWKARLAGAPPLLEIPTDRPRAPGQSARAGIHYFALPPLLAGKLRALARREGATLFMTLLAGWQALLGRYAGQDDVVVGSPVAGRSRLETEGLIGFFVNMLALRADLAGDPAWADLLKRVREDTLGAYDHQELPFERLVEELDVERSLTHAPVFQNIFTLNVSGGDAGPSKLGDLDAEPFGGDELTAKFDLDLLFADSGEELGGVLVYIRELFDADTVVRMGGHLETLLEAVVAGPERRLSELPLLRPGERARLLEESVLGAAGVPCAPVHELFARQAERTPDAPAASFGDESLTYAELESRANRLARLLRGRGVGPEVRVGICLDRSPELLAAVLGVLKAGGAYVPLDPAYPAERLAYTLADSGASVLLTRSPLLERLPAPGGEVVCLDREREAPDGEPDGAPPGGAGMRNAAYVIYTSGSTGTPKGVVVEHAGLASTLLGARDALALHPGELFLVTASFAFDIWAFEALAPLLVGGRVRLLPREAVLDVGRLVDELAAADAAHMVPALMREVARKVASGPGTLPRLRRAFVGGDAVSPDLIDEMRRAFPSARLHVLYGPTEATILGAAAALRAEGRYRWQVVGRPLPGARLYVCGAGGDLLPAGAAGELWIGGTGVARGYLGRPDSTAERFVPDPFADEAGARLYRTGDRVRRRPDGELEFLGRLDAQVKIRGFRIEPGEVEAVLLEQEGVREAAVAVREDAPGQKRLVAYVVAEEGAALPAAERRARLAARLPEYMVPGAFVAIARLPLNASGKVDRRALPAPGRDPGGYAAPRTPTEEVLAGIWEEVLGVERVGVEDNFFELGGHSLLATRVVSRVRQALGVELPLRALFEAPAVTGLAARVDALRAGGEGAQAPPLVPVARDGSALPLSFAQQRLWFIDQLEPGSAAYNMPFALRLRGRLDPAVLERSLGEIVRRHETLRTVFATVEGEPVQVVRGAAAVAVPVTDLRGLPAERREAGVLRLASEEAARPFDLAAGPLLRVSAVRLEEAEWAVLWTMHHIVSDGWSMGLLIREVSALYGALSKEGEAELPELPVQYADYAVWQRAWLTGPALESRLGYWRQKLGGAPPLLELPTDRPRPQAQDARGGSVRVHLPAEVSHALRALSRREGATVFMTLLAAWQLLLARYADVEDVSVGTPVAGRTRLETEGLIGFFLNTLVLRTDLSGEPTFGELLGRVRETTLGAYQHQEVPFERLVEELAPQRSLAHTPLFQAMLVLQNNERGELRLGALEAEPLASGGGEVAKFDLTLGLAEEEGVSGSLSYRAELWERATVERMAGHFARLVEAVVADPSLPAMGVAFLGAAEREQLLVEWNATDAGYPAGDLVHGLFAAQALRTPEAVALVHGGEETTYAELDAAANRLAHLLRRRGVGAEVRVGVFMERRPELLVALLGVLKAGGAYVPLDPAYPRERLAYMVEDAGLALVLTTAALADRVPGAQVLALDAAAAELAREPAGEPRSGVLPENLSHVIFTSGSTGRPKGVMIRHASTAVLTHWMRENVSDGERSGVLWSTSVNFDVSVAEVFGTLCWGGRLVLVENALALPEVADRGIVYASMVPTAAAELLRAGGIPESVRTLNLGGEPLPADLAQALYATGTVEKVGNLYGPTEDTTYSTYSRVERGASHVLVGRPVANTRAYVLDGRLQPVPAGVVGELYLAGGGTARGYAARPELTAERFVPDPYGEPGGRMYRVMDRVRRLATGELEYFGRTDFQVKVRGFRIELGEIETALERHERVHRAVAVVRGDPSDTAGPRIVAYVVDSGAEVGAAELRAHLRERLPEYMVPSAFVSLAELPLTPSGKVDRRALPAPETGEAAREAPYASPRDALETTIGQIFEEVLGVAPVGLRDDFFELGGHSLLAVQLVSRVEKVLGVRLPVATLFTAPTVERLAEEVRRGGGGEMPLLVPIRPGGSRTPLFLVHPVGGEVMAYAALARRLHPEQPVYGIRSRGTERDEKPNWTVEEMACEYLAAIREVQPAGPYRLGGWSLGGVVAFEAARQLEAAGEVVETLLLIDSRVPWLYDPGRNVPQNRAVLVQMFANDLGASPDQFVGPEADDDAAGELAHLHYVLVVARAAGLVPAGLDLARLQHLYGIFCINLKAMFDYRPESYGGRVVLLRAGDTKLSERLFHKKTMGWEQVALGGVEVRTVPGTHYTMVREPQAEALAREVERALRRSER